MAATDLSGRVIVITGASSGIGRATAIECGAAGMHVVLAARRFDRLEQAATEIEAAGGRALPVQCDVQCDDQVDQMVRRTLERFDRLDAVFANAGYACFSPVLDVPDDRMRDIFETNYHGTLRCIRAAVPVMRDTSEWGHVLICTSAASEISIPMYGAYAATKAAQDSIGGALRAELHGDGIAVSTVHPIGTRTELFEAASKLSPNPGGGLNTPAALMHSAERVARAVVRCLRRPRPEVWPSVGTRWGVALTTAVPFLGAWSIRKIMLSRCERKP